MGGPHVTSSNRTTPVYSTIDKESFGQHPNLMKGIYARWRRRPCQWSMILAGMAPTDNLHNRRSSVAGGAAEKQKLTRGYKIFRHGARF